MDFNNPIKVLANAQGNAGHLTRQQLLDAIDEFFKEHKMTRFTLLDSPGKVVRAFGIRHSKDGLGAYGLDLEAAPAACGTGIIFTSQVHFNIGQGWRLRDELKASKKRMWGRQTWSTSQNLKQFGASLTCDSRYFPAIKSAFRKALKTEQATEQGKALVERMARELGGNSDGKLKGPGYSGQVVVGAAQAEIELVIRTTDIKKAKAILEMLD